MTEYDVLMLMISFAQLVVALIALRRKDHD